MNTIRCDRELVQAGLEGDLGAFEKLVERYQDVLYRHALCYVHRREEAQDIVQEAFLKAFQELPSLNDPAKFGGWMRSAIRNSCLNLMRSNRRRTAVREEIERGRVEEKPDAPWIEGIEMASVRELLSRLPEENARMFTMHYVEDQSIKSIARQFARSAESVKQRLYRARHQLQKEVLTMVKDSLEREKLPDDFPGRVVAHLLERGREDRLHMRYADARERFNEALEAAPDSPEALLELGRTYDPLGWPSQNEIGTLERAAEVAPDSIDVLCEQEIAYRQPGYEEEHGEVSQKLLELCERRLDDDSRDIRALKCRARLAIGAGDFAAAEQLLLVAVEEGPEDQEARFYLAHAINRQDRYEEALAGYERVCAIDTQTVWAYFALRQLSTHLAFRKREGERAVELMEEVWSLTQRPDEAGNLIYFYSATGQLREALEVFSEVEEHRHPPRVYVTVGIACMKGGDLVRARQMLEKGIELTSDNGMRAEAQLYLAKVLFALGELEEGKVGLEEGLKLDVEGRAGLAQKKESAFWGPWTKWLIETLEDLQREDRRVEPLLGAVCSIQE
ncbi:MAG: sigma-70 family RNA polymerase sigma factor [Gemmatimonadetes bacterium]|nr:sigma-70 family RNA polymerase sigma factor [Gemmatimonadota bacterium]